MNALDFAHSLIAEHDPSGELPQCHIKRIEIGPAALESIPNILNQFVEIGKQIVVICDKVPIYRLGKNAKLEIQSVLEKQFKVSVIELEDGHPELHASEEVIKIASVRAVGCDAIVSIGGGTITDIAKMTSVALDGVPHVAIQTAASVDGFSDNVSVIQINGVKRTVPSRWPEALIADTNLISEAPERLNRAGFGEIYSMFTAPADWRLAAILGFEKKFHWAPISLLHGVGDGIDEWSIGLKDSEATSIDKLVNALAVRGIVTGVADTTACLSGIEHLYSHMLDMHHTAHHQEIGQHGAQVGVGSVLAASVWKFIFANLPDIDISRIKLIEKEPLREKVFQTFDKLDNNHKLSQECWNDYEKKIDYWNSHLNEIQILLSNWQEHESELKNLIKSPEKIEQGLINAGSPSISEELLPQVNRELSRWALEHCHFMRNRFVGIDLLQFLGLWNSTTIEKILGEISNLSSKKVDQL